MSIWKEKTTKIGACVLSAALASPGAAQEASGWCYERIYSDAHLDAHPQQVVWQMRLKVGADISPVSREIALEVIAANQGHARDNDNHGRVLTQLLLCRQSAGQVRCAAECDGGGFDVEKMNANTLTFQTDFLMVGEDGCGGRMDLAEVPGQAVSYRLDRVDDNRCEGL